MQHSTQQTLPSPPFVAVIIGPSGSGKTTISRRLQTAFHQSDSVVHINLRDRLLQLREQDRGEVGDFLRGFWKIPHITSNVADVSLKILSEVIDKTKHRKHLTSFIIEGTPQTLTEASKLEALLFSKDMHIDTVIQLLIDEDQVAIRSSDPFDKRLKDESESKAAQHRRRNLASVAKFYEDRNILFPVDASQTEEGVFQDALRIITKDRLGRQRKVHPADIEPVKLVAKYLPAYSKETVEIKKKMKIFSGSHFDKFPGSHSASLTRESLSKMKDRSEDYVYSIKANGMRFFLLFTNQKAYFINRKLEVYDCTSLFPVQTLAEKQDSLFDGEIVSHGCFDDDPPTNPPVRVLYIIFDSLYNEGKNIKKSPIFRRLKCADFMVVKPFHIHANPYMIDSTFPRTCHYLQSSLFTSTRGQYGSNIQFSVCLQHYYKFHEIEDVLNWYIAARRYPTDGLVFSNIYRAYKLGLDENTHKWKPLTQNTVDFALKKERTRNKSGRDKHTLQVLDDNGRLVDMGQIELRNEEVQSLETGMILECWWEWRDSTQTDHDKTLKFGQGEGDWRLVRVREDKDTPNPEWLVLRIWESIKDAIYEEELISLLKSYHMGSKQSGGGGYRGRGYYSPRVEALSSPTLSEYMPSPTSSASFESFDSPLPPPLPDNADITEEGEEESSPMLFSSVPGSPLTSPHFASLYYSYPQMYNFGLYSGSAVMMPPMAEPYMVDGNGMMGMVMSGEYPSSLLPYPAEGEYEVEGTVVAESPPSEDTKKKKKKKKKSKKKSKNSSPAASAPKKAALGGQQNVAIVSTH